MSEQEKKPTKPSGVQYFWTATTDLAAFAWTVATTNSMCGDD